MKYISLFSIATIFSFISFSSITHAQVDYDPTGDSNFMRRVPKILRIHVEYYEINTLEYAELIGKQHTIANDSKMRDLLLQMAKDKKAKLIDTQTVTSRSGERATAESVYEYIYPTEYEPRNIIAKTKNNITSETTYEPIATAFETRNVGSILEVEPIIGEDGKTIDITFRPEITKLIGHSEWESNLNKQSTPIKMPTFNTQRFNTSLTMIKGQFHMAGAFNPLDEENKVDPSKKLLIFIKADILTVR